jgi:hypothetical protein
MGLRKAELESFRGVEVPLAEVYAAAARAAGVV